MDTKGRFLCYAPAKGRIAKGVGIGCANASLGVPLPAQVLYEGK